MFTIWVQNNFIIFFKSFTQNSRMQIDSLEVVSGKDVYTFSNRKEIIYKNNQVFYDKNKEEKQKKEDEYRELYGDSIPEIGMREEALEYTILGKPNSEEKCLNYDHYRIERKSKTYKWGKYPNPGYWEVVIRYRYHRSHRYDDYIDYPIYNGYVSSIYYIDKENNSIRINEYDDNELLSRK